MRRFVSIALVVFVGLLVGAAFAVHSNRFEDAVRERIARALHDELGLVLHVDDLELQLFPPGASFSGLDVRDAGATESWLEAHRGSAFLRPWPSRTGALVVDELMLDGLALDTTARRPRATAPPEPRRDASPSPAVAMPTRAPSSPKVDVRSVRLWNARGHVVTEQLELRFARVDALLEPTETGRTLDVSVPDATIVRAGTTVRLEAQLRGRLEGSLDTPTRVVLERAKVALPRVAATASGSIELAPSLSVALDAQASATLAGITSLFPELPRLSGDVTADLEVTGPIADLTLRGKANARALRVAGVLVGDVAAEVSHRAGGLHVAAFEVKHPRAGRLTGSGTVALEGDLAFEASARAHDVVLEELLSLAGLPHAWVRMIVSGDAHATGALLRLPIQLDAELVGTRFAVLDDRFENPNARPMFGLAELRARGPLTIGESAVTLDDVTVSSGSTTFSVEGSLGLTPKDGMNLRAVSTRARLDDLSPVGELALGGRGKAALSVEGPYEDPVVSGTLELDALDLLGASVGAVKGTLVYEYPTLSFDRVALQRGSGSSSGTASIDFSTSPPTLEAHADFEAIPLTAALEAARLPQALRDRFSAKLTGSVRASGPVDKPKGTVTLQTYAVSFDSVAMGEARLVAGFGGDDELVHGRLQMSPRGGALDMRLALLPQGQIALTGSVAQVPLALFSPFAGDLALEGTTSGRVDLAGAPTQLTGQLSVAFREAKIAGVELATSRLEVRLDKGQGELEGTLLSGAVQATSSFTLAEGLSYLCSATFTDLDAGKLRALPAGVRARGTGTLTARGALARPNSLVAEAHFSALELGWNQLSLAATRPARLAFGPQGLVVKDLQVEGNGMQLELQGQAPTDGSLKLSIQGGGSLGVVGLMAPTLGATRGRFDLALRLVGTWASPVVDGVARLSNASVAFRNAPVTLEEVEGVVRFAGRSISIERATGKVGGGGVRMGGQILWDDLGKAELSLRTDLDGVQLAPMADLTTTLSGNLTLQGPVGGLELRGNVRLDSLRYTRNFDLVGLIPTGASPPLRVPALEPSETVELSVKITAPGNLFIMNNVLEAELGAELLLTGTTNRMGVYGSVTPRWARARFRDTTFELERSSIDFTEEYRVAAQFDLRARAKACGMDVQMSVFGDSQNYTVVPSGQDESGAVDPQDVLTCLNFGLRLRDLENASARGRGTFDTAFPGGLDALWSVSGLDEKVRRVLPIGLDEVRLTSSWSARSKRTEPRLLVGKEVGKNLELKYSRALESTPEGWTDQMLSLEYRLSNIATVEGTWLSVQELPVADFGLDLRLRWEFR